VVVDNKKLIKGTEARASVDFDFQSGDYAKMTLKVSALYEKPIIAALPSEKPPATLPPRSVSMAVKIGDFSPIGADKLQIQLGQSINPVKDLNAPDGFSAFGSYEQDPKLTINPNAQDLVSFNPYELWVSEETTQISFSYGKDNGNRFLFIARQAQLNTPSDSDDSGKQKNDLEFSLTSTEINQQLAIIAY